MKHKNLMIMLTMLMSMAVGCMTLVSCGDDEVAPYGGGGNSSGQNAEQNTTDVAVTGGVSDINALYAKIGGVVNLDVITASYTNVEIGVEVSTTQNFAKKQRTEAAEVVGRKFSVYVFLEPSTKYYYRTYVSVSSLAYDYYGETYSFSTKNGSNAPIAVTGSAEDLGNGDAQITGKTNLVDVIAMGANVTVGIEIDLNSDFPSPEKLTSTGSKEEFSLYFENLKIGKEYYYRTFVNVETSFAHGIYYGEPKTFNTGHGYIDLALPSGTLWATHNIGATKPEDYGSYFAWGETKSKSTYSESNWTYSGNLTELATSDDAAYVNWGANWCMPSQAQFSELINSNYTTTTWTTQNGVYGRKITSKMNGNSIFLPAAGCRVGSSLDDAGKRGYYWSRKYNAKIDGRHFALDLYIDSGNFQNRGRACDVGQSVRPVRLSK